MLKFMKINFKESKEHIFTCLALFYMYILFNPIEIFFTQPANFSFVFSDFIGPLLLKFTILSIVAFLLISFEKLVVLKNLLFWCLIASYLQYLFFNLIDNSINENFIQIYTIINLIIWFAILIATFFIPDKVKKYISIIILFTQIITTVTVFVQNINYQDKYQNRDYYCIDGTEQYTVSSDSNIIVIILDRVPNELFDRTLKSNPEMINCLNDFTYYNDCNGGYDGTYLGINCLITGQEYKGNVMLADWYNQIWTNEKTNNFYNTLKDNNYKINFYTAVQSKEFDLNYMHNIFDNIVKVEDEERVINTEKASNLLLKLSISKLSCTYLKDAVGLDAVDYTGIVTNGTTIRYHNFHFYEKLQDGFEINDNNNYFIIQHINGVHGMGTLKIYTTNEKCEYVEQATDEENMVGCMVLVDEYIKQLKECGAYDNATIIITSDHGEDHTPSRPQPIFFMKLPNEIHSSMQVNTSKIDHKDFMPTVLDVIGEDYSEYGISILDQKETDERERIYRFRIKNKDIKPAPKYLSNANSLYNQIIEIRYNNKEEIQEKFDNNDYETLPLLEGMW